MTSAVIEHLRGEILDVERAIESGTYRPGPWAGIVRRAGRLSRAERLQLGDDISRVSDKLHRHNHPGPKMNARRGAILELVGALDGLIGLYVGLRWDSPVLFIISTVLLCATWQPLIKMLAGTLMGVRYSYFYLHFIIEPRVKMRYGTYLALSTTQRVILHFAGMIGSPAAFLVAAPLAAADGMPTTAAVFQILGWGFVGLNLLFFVLALAGVRRIERVFGGGAAAREILNSLRARAA